jgi:hypothetical protein
MKRILLFVVGVFLAAGLLTPDVWAQATAQITGAVRDQTGAVLPGVEVTATHTETGIVRNGISNETGLYVLPNLAVGPYRLEAALPGFRTHVQTGIVLQVNSSPVINIALEVGQVTEQVEVQANAALVETQTSTVGAVIENERILELPLNGRNVTDLITLSGAAVQTDIPMNKLYAGSNFISSAGGLGIGMEYTLDGARHVNFTSGTSMQLPFPDALQEFKIETTGMSASRGASASVGAVTKSGTNEFHGDLFEFIRNDLFNARNYFATTNSTLKRNQFGGTVGGPIKKNKLFFFAGFQDTITRQDPADTIAFLPTPAMMAGDWTTFTSPACNAGRTIALRAPFVNNRIDPAQYSPAARNILSRVLPKAPTPDACGQITFGRRNVSDEYQIVSKADFQWSEKHSIFGRFLQSHLDNPPSYDFTPDNILTTGTGLDAISRSIALGDTYLLSPNAVNAFRFSANLVSVWRVGTPFFSYCDVGVRTFCGYAPTFTNFNITGGFGLSSNNVDDNKYIPNNYAFSDDVSLVRGSHQFAFGGTVIHGTYRSKSDFVAAGTMTFNGQVTGLGMGDFLTGRVATLVMGTPNDKLALTQTLPAMYATDIWKIRPRITLNYGLRWEPFVPQAFDNGAVLAFDEDRFHQGIKSTAFRNAPAGWYFSGDPDAPEKAVANTKWMQFAPRMGIAWDVNGDGKTSVRASYAYSYNFVNALWREDSVGSAPWGNRTTIQSVSLDDPWRDFPGGVPFPVNLGTDARFAAYSTMQSLPFDIKTPTTSSWNLSVQRQIHTDWLASASYIGNQIVHIWTQKALNPAIFIPGNCQAGQFGLTAAGPCSATANTNQRRRFSIERPQDGQYMGSVSQTDYGTQNYNGLLLSLQRRAARGISVSTNYTWSHCVGDYADVNSQGPAADETFRNPTNRRIDRGDCFGERRQMLNLTGLAETPQFANRTMRTILSGWRLSGIYTVTSGRPFTVVSGSDRSLTGTGLGSANNQPVDQVMGDVYGDRSGRPMTSWLNFSAFAQPTLGTFGNTGRNTVRGPKEWSFDLALSRAIAIRESQKLEFRMEAFNVTNSFRPAGISTQGTSGAGAFLSLANPATFGVLRSSLDPRILQFALKYVF